MKMRLAVTLVGLAIGFVLPTFAQQKDTADARIAQQHDLIGDPKALDEFGVLATKQEEAFHEQRRSRSGRAVHRGRGFGGPGRDFFR